MQKEEKARQERIADWDRHQEGKGYRNKYRPVSTDCSFFLFGIYLFLYMGCRGGALACVCVYVCVYVHVCVRVCVRVCTCGWGRGVTYGHTVLLFVQLFLCGIDLCVL